MARSAGIIVAALVAAIAFGSFDSKKTKKDTDQGTTTPPTAKYVLGDIVFVADLAVYHENTKGEVIGGWIDDNNIWNYRVKMLSDGTIVEKTESQLSPAPAEDAEIPPAETSPDIDPDFLAETQFAETPTSVTQEKADEIMQTRDLTDSEIISLALQNKIPVYEGGYTIGQLKDLLGIVDTASTETQSPIEQTLQGTPSDTSMSISTSYRDMEILIFGDQYDNLKYFVDAFGGGNWNQYIGLHPWLDGHGYYKILSETMH